MKQLQKKTGIIMAVCMGVLLSGCAGSIPELSEQENAIVAEYAAGLLLKYDKNYSGELPLAPPPHVEESMPEQPEAPAEEPVPEETQQPVEEVPVQEEGIQELPEPKPEQEPMDIASFLGLQGIDITYTGYEVVPSYTDSTSAGGSIAFSLDATPGSQLLVANFALTNNSGEDAMVDIFNKNVRFRLVLNESNRKPALFTMLLNDLSIYKDTVAAGETKQVVIICEIAEEEAAIEGLSLYMTGDAGSAQVPLGVS